MKALRAGIPLVLLLAAPMAMLHPVWRNPVSAGEDDLVYFYPTRKMVGQALRAGRWPVGHPREATGSVLMADPQSAAMFPGTWLFAALEAKRAYGLSIFLAFAAAGLGTYAYLRRLALARAAATFGAFAMMFCGFLVGHRVHLSVIHAAALLPWGLWCIERLRHEAADCTSRGDNAGPGGTDAASASLLDGRTAAHTAAVAPDPASRRLRAFATWLAMVLVAYLAVTAGHWPTLIHMSLIWLAYFCFRARPFVRSLLTSATAAALAAAMAAPQLYMTSRLLAITTRQRIGYATAGENSFFPLSAVHALFPMLMGTRTPNFYPQPWWGSWHLCEMLGYVGLPTLVLAGVAVWRLYRKPKKKGTGYFSGPADAAPQRLAPTEQGPCGLPQLRPLVRVWTWLLIGAGVWMLGYYLPTYRLIHWLPVLGVVRCPARMVLAADMALVTLATISIHVMMRGGPATERMARTARRAVTVVLPAAMILTLVGVLLGGMIVTWLWPGGIAGLGFFAGRAADAVAAVWRWPPNPAVWVPLALAAATIGVVRFWLARPARRAVLLVALLIVDLFFVARFVDVPAAGVVPQDPDDSPAAAWLKTHAPKDRKFHVWGLSGSFERFGLTGSYHHRASELLLPRVAQAMGFSTINSYGPFHSPAHAHLFGFRIFGTNRGYADLLRRNALLSAYGVRYIIASDRQHRDVIEAVRIPQTAPPPEGPNLFTGAWELTHAERRGESLWLQTPVLWRPSKARHEVTVTPGQVYRIRLEARGPHGGAANSLQVECRKKQGWHYPWDHRMQLIAEAEQIGTDWRQFERTFRVPADFSPEAIVHLATMSERPIEVRNLSFRKGHWPIPRDPQGRLKPGQAAYAERAELSALNPSDPPVAIYENLLWAEAREHTVPGTPAEIEAYKRGIAAGGPEPDLPASRPNVALTVSAHPRKPFWCGTVPALAVYLLCCVLGLAAALRAGARLGAASAPP